MENSRKIYLAQPHGMCAGVRRAIATVEAVLEQVREPVFVLHEIVHNTHVVRDLASRGVRFVEDLSAVPDGAVVLFSAHGVGSGCEMAAQTKRLRVVDATCPLVKRLQNAAREAGLRKQSVILLGHRGHPEVEGIVGRMAPGDPIYVVENSAEIAALPEKIGENPCLLCQTTLNTEEVTRLGDELRKKYPALQTGPGVCYATRERQNAVRALARVAPLILIIGSKRSSNSNRLREIAAESGSRAFLIDGPEDLPRNELSGVPAVGVSAGASAPESFVEMTIRELEKSGFFGVELVGSPAPEPRFKLPPL